MRVNPWLLLLLVLAGGLLFTLSQMLERYEEPVDRGWSEAALRNPFLAAEQFLGKRAVPVESSDRLDVLEHLTPDSILVISNANHVLSRQRAAELVEWMEAGGHVVVAAQLHSDDEPDVLLSRFEVRKLPVDEEDSADDDALTPSQQLKRQWDDSRLQREAPQQKWTVAETTRRREALVPPEELLALSFEGIAYSLQIEYHGSASLDHPAFYLEDGEDYTGYRPFYWAGNDRGIGFLQMDVGEGLLTVMADVSIWNSSRIALYDHAYLLQLMTEGSDQVIFLYGAVVPGLLELVWQHFQELVVALLLLLATWLWYRMGRFGPVMDWGLETRRSFGEHIEAVGHFFWRQKMAEELLDSVRQEIWHSFYRRYPGAQALSGPQKLQKLAQAAGMDAERVRRLMLGKTAAEEIRFYHHVRSLQAIRKAL